MSKFLLKEQLFNFFPFLSSCLILLIFSSFQEQNNHLIKVKQLLQVFAQEIAFNLHQIIPTYSVSICEHKSIYRKYLRNPDFVI